MSHVYLAGIIGAPEIMLLLLVMLVLFGAKRLPELARSLGRSISEFKKGQAEGATRLPEEKKTDTPDKGANA